MSHYTKQTSKGDMFYYDENNLLSRTDGPAVELKNGSASYWLHGIRHRIDGPAIHLCDGYKEWYVNGIKLTEEEFNRRYPQNLVDVKLPRVKSKNTF
jgi:hypothetical protein